MSRTSRRSFFLRMLNVYPNELWIVKRLYLFQFFQGAGIAFFFTAGFALFLDRMPMTEFAWVLIYSSLLLWTVGFLYTRLEHKASFRSHNMIIFVAMTASFLLFGTSSYLISQNWFYYWLLAWFNVLYLVNNLQFWGIATLFFDLRQSKRLFTVISAGDIPAKFFGYTLALIIVPYTGTRNLIFIGAACMLASLPFLKSIIRSGEIGMLHKADQVHHQKQSTKHIGKLVKNFAHNIFIRRIAFISLITTASIILINYGFYSEVKGRYENDVELARFIALFFAALRITALITKMIVASRVTASIGMKSALFITPVGMLLIITTIFIANWDTPGEKIIFYLFAVASIVVDVLRTSFSSPVLLALIQPLGTHERLRAHNIVKGFMDPFASLFCGVLLFTSFTLRGKVDLMFLCYMLAVLGVLWIAGVILVNRQYLHVLIKTISTRYFSQEEFDLSDEAIVQHIQKKIASGTELEVISILRMLASNTDPVAEDLIARLLSHPSDQVKLEALKLIDGKYVNIKANLQSLLSAEVSAAVKSEAVRTFCKIADNESEVKSFLDDQNEDIRKACLTGMLENSDEQIKKIAESVIDNLLLSDQRENKKKVISILNEVKDNYSHQSHAALIEDADFYIRDLAIMAVGKASDDKVLFALMEQINGHEKRVLASLYNVGEPAVPLLRECILSNKTSDSLKQKLVNLCGRIGGEKVKEVLIELLRKQPQLTAAIARALHRCKYTADESTHQLLENISRMHIVYGVELLYMQQALFKGHKRYDALNSSLHHEIQEIREILLCLFECMYDREKINRAKFGLNAKSKESIANAMEIIELTVKKDIARNFNILFDETSIDHRCQALRSLFTEKRFVEIESILARILSEKPINYQAWTKACSMYFSKKFLHQLDAGLFEKYLQSENSLLKETALFASVTPII
jgi:ATP:ADP antiporter, AAA family